MDVVAEALASGGSIAEVGGTFEKTAASKEAAVLEVCKELSEAALGETTASTAGFSACKAATTELLSPGRRLQGVPLTVLATLYVNTAKVSAAALGANLKSAGGSFASLTPVEKSPADVAASVPGVNAEALGELQQATSDVKTARAALADANTASVQAPSFGTSAKAPSFGMGEIVGIGFAIALSSGGLLLLMRFSWSKARKQSTTTKVLPFTTKDMRTSSATKDGSRAQRYSKELQTCTFDDAATPSAKTVIMDRVPRMSKERAMRYSRELHGQPDEMAPDLPAPTMSQVTAFEIDAPLTTPRQTSTTETQGKWVRAKRASHEQALNADVEAKRRELAEKRAKARADDEAKIAAENAAMTERLKKTKSTTVKRLTVEDLA